MNTFKVLIDVKLIDLPDHSLTSKPTVVIPLVNETGPLENSITYRFFFLIHSLNPIEFKLFSQGLVTQDDVRFSFTNFARHIRK